MGDVDIAAFLSGGLDSSAITALAAAHRPLPAVTTTYDTVTGTAGHDDLRYSRLMATHLHDRVHHHITIQPHTVDLPALDATCDLAAIGDDPRHAAILGNYRAVQDLGIRVVLNGQGADEIMGGYIDRPRFVAHLLDVRRPDAAIIHSLPASRQIPGLTPRVLAQQTDAHDTVLTYHRSLPGTPLERAHRLLFHTQLRRVVQFEDFLSMRTSVEARFPFLDHHLVEWAFRQNFDRHIHAPTRTGKIQLIAAMRPHLPTAVLTRRKAVFPAADESALHAALAGLAADHVADLRADPLVSHLMVIPEDPTRTSVDQLWPLLSLWRWHQRLQRGPTPVLT